MYISLDLHSWEIRAIGFLSLYATRHANLLSDLSFIFLTYRLCQQQKSSRIVHVLNIMLLAECVKNLVKHSVKITVL